MKEITFEQKSLLRPTEYRFYKVLREILEMHSADMILVPQVPLSGMINMKCDLLEEECRHHFHRGFNQYTIDFVLFNRSFHPVLAIELNDVSHLRPERAKRDRFVRLAFRQSRIKFLAVPVAKEYDTDELYRKIMHKIKNEKS